MFIVTPVFADYSLSVILIEKEIRQMILDINREIRYIFSIIYDILYRLGLDGISECFNSSTLIKSPRVPHRYINKLCLVPISGVKFVL